MKIEDRNMDVVVSGCCCLENQYLNVIIIDLIYLISQDSFNTLMLFKSFEKQVISPFSTIASIPSQPEQQLCPEDHFQLNRCRLGLTLKQRASEIEKSVLDWFESKGICAGAPQLIKQEFSDIKIKKVISSRGNTTIQMPGLLERRLSKRLTINL